MHITFPLNSLLYFFLLDKTEGKSHAEQIAAVNIIPCNKAIDAFKASVSAQGDEVIVVYDEEKGERAVCFAR